MHSGQQEEKVFTGFLFFPFLSRCQATDNYWHLKKLFAFDNFFAILRWLLFEPASLNTRSVGGWGGGGGIGGIDDF